jgi:hypothetical protein
MKDKFEHLKTKSLDASSKVAEKAQEHLPKFWALKQSYRVVIIIIAVVVLGCYLESSILNLRML